MDSDESLMRRFQAGEVKAFAALFSKYASPLINFSYRFLNSREAAKDVTQEVFLRVYRSKEHYDPARPFRSWIFSIAARLAINAARNRKRHPTVSLDGGQPDEEIPLSATLPDPASPSAEETHSRQELAQAVKTALAALPENQRTAVLLCRFEGMRYEEIGKTMGLSVSAVKSLLFRAKHALAKTLSLTAFR